MSENHDDRLLRVTQNLAEIRSALCCSGKDQDATMTALRATQRGTQTIVDLKQVIAGIQWSLDCLGASKDETLSHIFLKKAALRFYSLHSNWIEGPESVEVDGGQKARHALRGLRK